MEVQLQTASVCSVYEKGGKKRANFHTEFVIVRDLAFLSRGGAGEREKKEALCLFYQGPWRKGLWGWDVV